MPYEKEVQKQYQKEWYKRNRDRIRERMKAYSKKNKLTVWHWFKTFKSTLCCIKCPENHPACLDFHHRDPSTKRFTISAAVGMGITPKVILEEIAKCDILCANCHRKIHYFQRYL